MNRPRHDILHRMTEAALGEGLTLHTKMLANGRIKAWFTVEPDKVRAVPQRREPEYEFEPHPDLL